MLPRPRACQPINSQVYPGINNFRFTSVLFSHCFPYSSDPRSAGLGWKPTRPIVAKATPGCPSPASQLLPDSVGEFMPALGLQEAGVGGWDGRGWSCGDVKRDRR